MPLLMRVKDKVKRIKRSVVAKFELETIGGRKVHVVEEAPKRRTIVYRPFGSNRTSTYQIKTPWAYFMVVYSRYDSFERACIFFSEKELKTEDQSGLGYAPLPNVFNRKCYKNPGSICFGRAVYNSDPKMLLERFWRSRFTGEVSREEGTTPESIEAPGWGILARWAALTRKGKDLTGFRPIHGRGLSSLTEAAEIISRS